MSAQMIIHKMIKSSRSFQEVVLYDTFIQGHIYTWTLELPEPCCKSDMDPL